MKLQFDVNHNVEDFTIILSTRGYEYYGEIRNVKRDSVTCKQNMNAANELSFEVYKTLDGVDERLWDNITDLKLVWVKELNEYYEISVSLDDSINPMKTITATSLCEAELSQVNLYNIEINSEADIERDAYEVTKFYDDKNPKASLLHRVLDKVPHYSIKHVDSSLKNLQRTFSIDGTSIYDWLVGECSEQFNCLFVFDTTDRSISAYDLYTVCKGTKEDGTACGHRGEFNDICPECGSTDLKYYGEDTTIFIDKENLTESVKFETDIGSVKNCFKLVAGDDDMTATVRLLNPNGTDYIYYISDEQKEDMPKELVGKIEKYDKLVASYTEEYEQLVEEIQEINSDIAYYEHSMMPTIEHAEVTASTEAAKLTRANLSPLALTSVTESTFKSTVESALKNYAKVYVKTGYVKLEINQSSYTYVSEGRGTWTGNFKVTNYSDEEDVVYSSIIRINVYGGAEHYEEFVRQKIMKSISNDNDDEGSVFDVLSIEELEDFKEALKLYCLVRLQSFYDAIQGALDVLMELDQATEEADLYSVLYEPYYNKLVACQSEIDVRAKKIEDLEAGYKDLDSRRNEIQKELNFEEYLGEDLYPIFCSYRREDTYSNDNYISDGLDNAEIFDKARDFIQKAKEELYKSAMHQHSISSTLNNLLIMPEFRVLVDKFELGNWIRISVDEKIYRLRLISYEINFSEIQILNVEFSDLTKQVGCVSDLKSVLESAQSMATNYNYISKQAEKGNEANKSYENLRQDGLDAALIKINNNVHEEITYGKHGLLARSYNDVTDDYDPEQLRITHNIACYTNNNWKSVKMAIGKINYRLDGVDYEDYGVNADTLIGGKMISGDIYSLNYSSTNKIGTYINLNDGSFTFGGGSLTYSEEDGLHVTGNIEGGSLLIGDKTSGTYAEITEEGMFNANGVHISGTISSSTINGGTILGAQFMTSSYPQDIKISQGSIHIYGTLNDQPLLVGTIYSTKEYSSTSNDYNGFGLIGNGTNLSLGVGNTYDTTFKYRYCINNGGNIGGHTEDNIWFGTERHTGNSYFNGTITSNVGAEYAGFITDGDISCNKLISDELFVYDPLFDGYFEPACVAAGHRIMFQWTNSRLAVYIDKNFIGYVSLSTT